MRSSYVIVITLAIVALMLLVVPASANVYYSGGAGITFKGPDGVLVPLGFPLQYFYMYNWIAIGFLFLIGASASQRNAGFFAILLPLFAGMFVWFGWLSLPTASNTYGLIIISAVLAVAVYMKGRQQEKFGIAGPGSPFLNIVFWMIILQASIGFINATGLFAANTSITTPNLANVEELKTDVPDMARTGGFFNTITSDAMLLGTAAFSAMTMIWKMLMAIVYFKGLVLDIIPFAATVPLVDAFLTVFTVAIDFIVAVAIWTWLFRPPMTETT